MSVTTPGATLGEQEGMITFPTVQVGSGEPRHPTRFPTVSDRCHSQGSRGNPSLTGHLPLYREASVGSRVPSYSQHSNPAVLSWSYSFGHVASVIELLVVPDTSGHG